MAKAPRCGCACVTRRQRAADQNPAAGAPRCCRPAPQSPDDTREFRRVSTADALCTGSWPGGRAIFEQLHHNATVLGVHDDAVFLHRASPLLKSPQVLVGQGGNSDATSCLHAVNGHLCGGLARLGSGFSAGVQARLLLPHPAMAPPSPKTKPRSWRNLAASSQSEVRHRRHRDHRGTRNRGASSRSRSW